MDRRRFLVTSLAGAVAAPIAAGAEQGGRIYRIGILANIPLADPEGAPLWGGFIQGLQELGYVEGQNVTIEWRVSGGKYERLHDLAAELGGNVTGFSAIVGYEIVGKRLELLKATVAQLSRSHPLESRQPISRKRVERGEDRGAVVDDGGSNAGGARGLTTS